MKSSRLATILSVLILAVSTIGNAQDKSKAKKNKKKRKPNPVFQQIKDDPKLPRVLLIGDSISIGYTLDVRAMLKGKVNVHRPPTNCGPTTRGLKEINKWLGEKQWDVVHFNWGLHDLKFMGPKGQNLADPKAADSHQQVPPAEYEKNLRKLVERMKKSGKTLIWRSTTPVPEGAKGRVVGDSLKYNVIAAKIMKEQGIAIDDMYSYSKPRLKQIQRPANVHFTRDGSRELAKGVVKSIETALARQKN